MSQSNSVIWRCDACGQKNRIRLERWSEQPTCGKCDAALQTGVPQDVRGLKDFQQRISESGLPVLVDFWADWCGPCHMIAPALKDIAKDLDGELIVLKVNTEDNRALSAQFQVQSIPTLMLFKQGELMDRLAGALPKPQLEKWVRRLL